MSAANALPIEYLGHDPRRRLPRRWAAVALAVAVALVMLPVWANAVVVDRANAAMSAAYAQSQRQIEIGEGEVLSTLAYAQPMIWSALWPESTRAGLRDLVQGSAADASERLAQTRAEVAGTLVLPWQSAQRDARIRLLALLDAEQARFARIAADARAIAEVLGSPRPPVAAVVDSLRASGAEAPPIR
jgi:hypothetical protein